MLEDAFYQVKPPGQPMAKVSAAIPSEAGGQEKAEAAQGRLSRVIRPLRAQNQGRKAVRWLLSTWSGADQGDLCHIWHV